MENNSIDYKTIIAYCEEQDPNHQTFGFVDFYHDVRIYYYLAEASVSNEPVNAIEKKGRIIWFAKSNSFSSRSEVLSNENVVVVAETDGRVSWIPDISDEYQVNGRRLSYTSNLPMSSSGGNFDKSIEVQSHTDFSSQIKTFASDESDLAAIHPIRFGINAETSQINLLLNSENHDMVNNDQSNTRNPDDVKQTDDEIGLSEESVSGMNEAAEQTILNTTNYDVLFLYNKDDFDIVKELAEKVKVANFTVYLDVWNAIAGQSRQEQVENAMDRSKTVIVCHGSTGMSAWHAENTKNALDRKVTDKNLKVILAMIPGSIELDSSQIPESLKRLVEVDFRAGLNGEDGWQLLLRSLES